MSRSEYSLTISSASAPPLVSDSRSDRLRPRPSEASKVARIRLMLGASIPPISPASRATSRISIVVWSCS